MEVFHISFKYCVKVQPGEAKMKVSLKDLEITRKSPQKVKEKLSRERGFLIKTSACGVTWHIDNEN